MKKITLITGAGRGIGYGIAKKFAENDNDLILLVRKNSQIKNLLNLEKEYNINVKVLVGDLRNKNFVEKLNKVQKIDNLINNASGENTKYFTSVSQKDVREMLEINLISMFRISQIFAKKMIKKKIKGNIISLSSQLGHIGAQNRTLYSMTKFALEGLTKSLALDLGRYGIRVNTVSPTKTIVNFREKNENTKRLKLIKHKIPLKKFSTVDEIASIVYFLTTNNASSITGTSIISDGGWTAGK